MPFITTIQIVCNGCSKLGAKAATIGFAKHAARNQGWQAIDKLSLCPTCLKEGYSLIFHDPKWKVSYPPRP